MLQGRSLVRNTLLLTVTSLLLRTVGVSYNVFLTKSLGTVGLGALQLVMTAYSFSITLASSGVRLAATRMIAESRQGHFAALRFCMAWGFCTGSAAALLAFVFAPTIGRVWLGVPETVASLRILAAGLPFIAMSSAIGGLFTATGRIPAQATVQVLEQAVQVLLTLLLLPRWRTLGLAAACAAIAVSILLSELCSFLFSAILAFSRREKQLGSQRRMLRRFVRIAAPDALGAWIGSSLRTAQGLLIPHGLRRSGADSDSAVAAYGVIQGMVMPVILYPTAFLYSLSGLLVPEIAQSYARGQKRRISVLISRVLRWTAMFAIGTSGLILTLAGELSQAIYGDGEIAAMMRLFAPLLPLMYLDIVVDGMLKGLDEQLRSMGYNVIEASLGLLLVCVLIPQKGIAGYVATVFLSRTLNALLSLQRLAKVGEISLDLWRGLLLPCACALAASTATRTALGMVNLCGVLWPLSLGLAIYGCVYFFALWISGCLGLAKIKGLLPQAR